MSTPLRRPLAPDVVLVLHTTEDSIAFKLELKKTESEGLRTVAVDATMVPSLIAFFALPSER